MDQIVLIVDVECFLPDSIDQDVETLVERGLHDVKQAALKILTHGRVFERRGDISSFGFRFDFVLYLNSTAPIYNLLITILKLITEL